MRRDFSECLWTHSLEVDTLVPNSSDFLTWNSNISVLPGLNILHPNTIVSLVGYLRRPLVLFVYNTSHTCSNKPYCIVRINLCPYLTIFQQKWKPNGTNRISLCTFKLTACNQEKIPQECNLVICSVNKEPLSLCADILQVIWDLGLMFMHLYSFSVVERHSTTTLTVSIIIKGWNIIALELGRLNLF